MFVPCQQSLVFLLKQALVQTKHHVCVTHFRKGFNFKFYPAASIYFTKLTVAA